MNIKSIPILKIPENNPYLNALKYLFIFIPAIVYFSLVNKYALNIPSQDDYDAILGFLSKFETAHGLERMYLLISQHNEHRILSSRIVYVLYYHIFGNINFRSIIFIGNTQLFLVFIFAVIFIKKCLPGQWVIASFFTSLCLFDPNGWENADFAMGSMQNYGIIMLFTASLYFYSLSGRKYLFAGILLQLLCIYSSGNGIIAAGVIVFFNFLIKDRLKIIFSLIILLVFSPLYFVSYRYPAPQPHNYYKIIMYFFHLVCAHIYFYDAQLAIISGVILLVVFATLLPVNKKLQIRPQMIPFVCISAFLLASMGTISIFRSNEPGPAYCSRYLVYPHFVFAVTYIFLLITLQGKKIMWPLAISISLLMLPVYNMNMWGGIHGLEFLSRNLKSTDYYYPDKNGAKIIAEKACSLNIYCIEKNR